MKIKAYAKINLSLRVFEKRPDGYHSIESVMQSVSLHDLVTLSRIPSGIELTCDDQNIPSDKRNLAYKAAELFMGVRDEVRGVRVDIRKRIPLAAGLAGGSADAAAVLFGLNQLSAAGSRLSDADLIGLGSRIGSDVPFCLTGGTCLVKGRGEVVERQDPWPKTYFILVCPDIQVSSKWAYEEFDNMHLNISGEIYPHAKYFGVGIKNDLEPVVVSRHEVVAEIKERLLGFGCSEAQMSGSGPSVFGMVRQRAEAQDIFEKARDLYPRSFLVETVEQGLAPA